MLDNEPNSTTDPIVDAADTSTGTRRTRTTRRRGADPVEGPGTDDQASTDQASPEPAGDGPVKATRRRRKATEPDEPVKSGESSQNTDTAEPAPVAKRTRRKKAAEPAGDEPLGAVEAEEPAGAGRAALSATAVLFMPPSETSGESAGPRRRTAPAAAPAAEPADAPRSRRRAQPADDDAEPADAPRSRRRAQPAAAAAEAGESTEAGRSRRRRGRRGAEVVDAVEPSAEPTEDDDDDDDDDDDGDLSAAARRRRRRGRRGRGRGKGTLDGDDDATADEAGEAEEAGDAEGEGLTRRRRRRRRKGSGDVDADDEDGVLTVVKIREPRRVSDEVQGVSGSTRLEAKRQRRRDGRDQRRTRPPILSESEFLARREAVDRVMVVRQRGDRTQIAVLEDDVLVEHYVTRASAGTMAGNVYLGKVQNVLPSMEAAFVDIGRGRNAVLYAGEVNWDATGLEGRARSIEQALKSGDSVPVQVTKDPIGHKGARLTSHIALSGRHLVYVPHGNASGISRKLADNERKRLRDVLKKLVPDGAGVIVRTAAEGATEDELARDVKRLQAQWEDIQARATEGNAPVLLYEEPDLVIRVVRDLFNEDFRELVIQGDTAYNVVESYLQHVSPDLVGRLRRHAGVADVFADKRVDEQILKGLDRKVFLPSGGHLVIDRAEAMTVIDVNTGKYTGAGGNLEETVTRNNLEAAEEIVRQLRLRDLGGIIVIDFIDMVLESNRELVLRRLTECLGRDRTKHQVTEITSLGLVQMTRKRIGQGLLEAFSETCETCKGRGLIIHLDPAGDKKPGAGDKVKAVASASTTASARTDHAETETPAKAAKSSRRGRKAVDATTQDEPGYAESLDPDVLPDPDGLSDPDALDDSEVLEDSVLLDPDGLDDDVVVPDGADPDDLADDDEVGLVSSGRRRSRRGGARRRTRP